MNVYPKQTNTITEKQDPDWGYKNIEYWISMATFGGVVYTEMALLGRAVDGTIDLKDYSYVLNPYGVEDEKMKAFPAKLRNMDIISPVVELFLGEMARKLANPEVIVIDEDVETRYKQSLTDKMMAQLMQEAMNILNQKGADTGVDSKPVGDHTQTAQQHRTEWSDEQAIIGQQCLDYILAFNNFDEKKQRLYKDYLTWGRMITYKDVHFDDVKYETVSPLDFWCLKSADSPFIEDSLACVRRSFMLINDIIDKYRDELTDDQILALEGEMNQANPPSDAMGYTFIATERMDNVSTLYGRLTGGRIPMYHVTWKTLRKIGLLTYQNELGQTESMEVDENYVLNKDEGDLDIEWEWLSETWGGRQFGLTIRTPVKKLLVQRSDINNRSECKQPYNGRIEGTLSGEITSVVKKGLVYQVLYNVYHYRRELTINRNKDKIMTMPIGLIPVKFGKDAWDRFMYYIEANGIAFFDETKPNAAAVISAMKQIDLSLYQYLKGMTEVIESVKQEWWDAVGVNRQRYGDTMASDGKAVTEQAIFRSSIISVERNRKFNKALEMDYQGLVDCSKVAWVDGKKANFVAPDGRRVMMNIDPMKHCNTSYGIFVVDSDLEHENLKTLKDYAFGMAQKGNVKPSVVSEIIDGKNFAKLKDIIKKAEEAEQAIEQAQEDARNQTAKYVADKASEDNEQKVEAAKYTADRHYDGVVEAATIAAEAKLGGNDITAELEKLQVERERTISTERTKMEDVAQRREADVKKQALDKEKLKLEEEKIASQERIGKAKASKATK